MKISTTQLEGVRLIELDAFEDHRGYYIETYNQELYAKHGISQADLSVGCAINFYDCVFHVCFLVLLNVEGRLPFVFRGRVRGQNVRRRHPQGRR